MLPFLIAGAIGYGIAKLFEEGGETFGRGGITTNEGIIESFLSSNKDVRVGNLEAVEIDDIMYLRNYRTFIAKRMGDKVKISSQKYSKTTSTITNRLKALAQQMGYSVEYVSEKEIYDFDKFEGGGEVKYAVYEDYDGNEIKTKSFSRGMSEDEIKAPKGYNIADFDEDEDGVIYVRFQKEDEEYAGGGEAKRRRRANAQYGTSDRSVDKTRVGKPVGYRFTNSLASKLRKDQYAVPTERQVSKYLGKGIYKENRRNRSDRDKTAKL